jgi:hypothetical protein
LRNLFPAGQQEAKTGSCPESDADGLIWMLVHGNIGAFDSFQGPITGDPIAALAILKNG